MGAFSKRDRDIVRRFIREVASIGAHLEELRHFWARVLGISGPQWMIIIALQDLDQGNGVSVKAVAETLHVDPTFVTTQSKLLEQKGFVQRKTSHADASFANLSLTDKSAKHLADLASQQQGLNDLIFAEFDAGELEALTGKLALLERRLEGAGLKVARDL